jgi:hypothetical protein
MASGHHNPRACEVGRATHMNAWGARVGDVHPLVRRSDPVQQKLKEIFGGFMDYPYQFGSSLNAANLSYQTLKVAEVMKRLGHLEELEVND